jgi:cyclophilin family peptidyl-prolyl cis-trans isomerase
MKPLLCAALLLAAGLAGCAAPSGSGSPGGALSQPACALPATIPAAPANPRVLLQTNLGNITAEVFHEQVPLTADNFVKLAKDGFYDGTRFHRIITDFMMQGGDPNTRPGGDASKAGQGGPGYQLPLQVHWKLHHDPYMLSMANSGPNTDGSQFFITFTQQRRLDDGYSVFGRVVDGKDVVDRVNAEAASSDGTPKKEVLLLHATVLPPAAAAPQPLALNLTTFDGDHPVQQGAADTQFLLVAENDGDRNVPVCIEFPSPPAGLTAASEPGYANFQVPAGQRVAFVVRTHNEGAGGTLPVRLSTVGAQASLSLRVHPESSVTARAVKTGDTVEGNYIGMTVDGRLFDTSVKAAGDSAKAHGLTIAGFSGRPSYSTFSFTPGSGVIEGFTTLAVGTHAGGKSAARIAPEQAYGTSGQSPLAGRTLLFQLEIVSIQ